MSIYTGRIVVMRRANGDEYRLAYVQAPGLSDRYLLLKAWSNKRYADGAVPSLHASSHSAERDFNGVITEKTASGYAVISDRRIDISGEIFDYPWILAVHNNTVSKNSRDTTVIDWFDKAENTYLTSGRTDNAARATFRRSIVLARQRAGVTSTGATPEAVYTAPSKPAMPENWGAWA